MKPPLSNTMAPKRSYDPSLDRQRLDQLKDELATLLLAFCDHAPLVRGSFALLRRRCGKRRCRCYRGRLHESFVFISSDSGKKKIRKATLAEKRALSKPVKCYQRLRRLRARLAKLHTELLRGCDRLRTYRLMEGKKLFQHLWRRPPAP